MKTVAALPSFNSKRLSQALCVVIGVALLIVSAKIQIPFWPVPLTMQSAVVLMLPCVLGLYAGVTSVAIYLGLGAAGYPVFAQGAMAAMGPAYFAGPTGGYLIGFVAAAILLGFIAHRFKGVVALTGLMLLGHAVIFAGGVLWLAYGLPQMGWDAALVAGFMPFIAGTLAKSVFAAMCVRGITKTRQAS